MSSGSRAAASIALLALALAGCNASTGGSITPPPTSAAVATPSPGPSSHPQFSPSLGLGATPPIAVAKVTTPSQAAAVVFASNPLFSSITPPTGLGAVGQSQSYSATTGDNEFLVTVTMGSGDCLSGCINQHTWNYSVSYDGKVTLVSEQGDPFEGSVDEGTTAPATVHLMLVAGPVCPVERNPPDPSCAARPVGNVPFVLRDAAGSQVASGTADSNGVATFTVPGGAYYVDPGPVGGMMLAPNPTAFAVPGGADFKVTLTYDTGIR
ncbi:MAG TPA: hypothetical protein VH371_01430 [Candidatus Limnocylindrales bacterium]